MPYHTQTSASRISIKRDRPFCCDCRLMVSLPMELLQEFVHVAMRLQLNMNLKLSSHMLSLMQSQQQCHAKHHMSVVCMEMYHISHNSKPALRGTCICLFSKQSKLPEMSLPDLDSAFMTFNYSKDLTNVSHILQSLVFHNQKIQSAAGCNLHIRGFWCHKVKRDLTCNTEVSFKSCIN